MPGFYELHSRGNVVVMSRRKETVLMNVEIPKDLKEDFKIAAKLRGQSMSALLHQYMVKVIREEKDLRPAAFPDYQVRNADAVSPNKQTALEIMYEAFGGEEIRPELMKAIVNAVKMIQTAEQADVPVLPRRITKTGG